MMNVKCTFVIYETPKLILSVVAEVTVDHIGDSNYGLLVGSIHPVTLLVEDGDETLTMDIKQT